MILIILCLLNNKFICPKVKELTISKFSLLARVKILYFDEKDFDSFANFRGSLYN